MHNSNCFFSTLVRVSEAFLECLFRLFHQHRHTLSNGLCDRLKKVLNSTSESCLRTQNGAGSTQASFMILFLHFQLFLLLLCFFSVLPTFVLFSVRGSS